MKKILPVLLCYVLTASQMYAVDGGPVFTQNISLVGTFSGVLEGVTETDDTTVSGPAIPGDPLPPPDNGVSTPSNALGLFTLSVPSIGNATGSFILFADGIFFSGGISAFANPDSDKLQGVIEAGNSQADGGAAASSPTETAVGFFNATASGASYKSASLGNLNGTASLDVSFGAFDPTNFEPIVAKTLTFIVLGVEQSSAASASAASTGTGVTSEPTSSGG